MILRNQSEGLKNTWEIQSQCAIFILNNLTLKINGEEIWGQEMSHIEAKNSQQWVSGGDLNIQMRPPAPGCALAYFHCMSPFITYKDLKLISRLDLRQPQDLIEWKDADKMRASVDMKRLPGDR